MRDALRGGATEEQLLDIISRAVIGKKKQHAGRCLQLLRKRVNLFSSSRHACSQEYAEPPHDIDRWVKANFPSDLCFVLHIFY